MTCLLDVSLFVLDVAVWNTDRQRCLQPMAAMNVHAGWLERFRVRLAWSNDFFSGFPWSEARASRELTDFINFMTRFHGHVEGNGLLVTPDDFPVPAVLPNIAPDLLTADYLTNFREIWLRLLTGLICDRATVDEGVGVPTWEQPAAVGQTALQITNAADLSAAADTVLLLRTEADWQAFIQQFHRPDLSGRRVAVLGGERAAFERARQRLQTEFNAAECRRLPPAWEENRSQQETQQRLNQIDLLVICTNRVAHSDTEQVSNLRQAGALSCDVVPLNHDTANQIVEVVVDHFRLIEEGE